MKYRFLFFLSISVLFLLSCKKDDPTEAYLRGGNAMISTPDGNRIIAGYNYSSQSGYDGYLTKVSEDGEQLWSKYYGSGYTDGFYNVINLSSGGYVAIGFQNTGNGISTLYAVKTNNLGEPVWSYLGDGMKITEGFGIVETTDKGYIACGYIQDDSQTDRDIYLVKISSQGEKEWEKRYGTKNSKSLTATYDEAYAIIPAGDSGFYITGSLAGNVSCCGNAYLMKISSAGDSLWSKKYSEALGYSMSRLDDGNIVICGTIYTTTNGQDAYLVKTDAEGNKLWEKSYGTTGYDFGTGMVVNSDGSFAFTGFANKTASSTQDILLYKTDASGLVVWAKSFGGDNNEQGFGIVANSDGGYSVAGMSNSGGSYIFLNRTDSEGIQLWQKNLK